MSSFTAYFCHFIQNQINEYLIQLGNIILKFLKKLTIKDEKMTIYEDFRKFPCFTKKIKLTLVS